VPSTFWRLHDVVLETVTHDGAIAERWQQSVSSLPPDEGPATLRVEFEPTEDLPSAPSRPADYRQGELIEYYLDGAVVTARLPRFGQLSLDLAAGVTVGRLLPGVVSNRAAFEDLVAISLSPHLRRRGRFLIHAFAAERQDRAVLLVGPIGSGKTTTGVSLLSAGWRLLSNDSPIVVRGGEVLSYPGPLAVTRETLARVELNIKPGEPSADGKLLIDPQQICPAVWADRALVGAVVLIGLGDDEHHHLDPISPPEALRGLLPHSIEQWDRETMPEHLAVLRDLVERAPAWRLRLGPRVEQLPRVLADACAASSRSDPCG
jgi:hypothetical protein